MDMKISSMRIDTMLGNYAMSLFTSHCVFEGKTVIANK